MDDPRITAETVADFARYGVVCVRAALDYRTELSWITRSSPWSGQPD